MKTILKYITEKSGGSPDYIIHGKKEYDYDSQYARAFIFNTYENEILWSDPSDTHNDILFNIDDSVRKKLDLYINGVPVRNVSKLMKGDLQKNNKCGRIWVIPNNKSKHRKFDVYIAWWNEINGEDFYHYNKKVIKSYNKNFHKNIESYIIVDNNGKFVLVDPDNNKIEISQRDEKRKQDIAILKQIHLASQDEKKRFFANFVKTRDEKNQKIYNHTKSKTEAEWRSLRYQENCKPITDIINENIK